jgi:hypothetical protein
LETIVQLETVASICFLKILMPSNRDAYWQSDVNNKMCTFLQINMILKMQYIMYAKLHVLYKWKKLI